MTNIMLDLETLGNTANSVIIAIGAVKFDSSKVTDSFYTVVDAESCVQAGLTMDTSTVMWWMQQSEEARAAFKRQGVHIERALTDFSVWCEDSKVWGNGASFDNTILSNAYNKTNQQQPWKFYNDRCYRTIKSLFPDIKLQRVGTHHNAVDDARTQAEHLIEICKTYGIDL